MPEVDSRFLSIQLAPWGRLPRKNPSADQDIRLQIHPVGETPSGHWPPSTGGPGCEFSYGMQEEEEGLALRQWPWEQIGSGSLWIHPWIQLQSEPWRLR